jgi:hypothetical protein
VRSGRAPEVGVEVGAAPPPAVVAEAEGDDVAVGDVVGGGVGRGERFVLVGWLGVNG